MSIFIMKIFEMYFHIYSPCFSDERRKRSRERRVDQQNQQKHQIHKEEILRQKFSLYDEKLGKR